MKIKIQKILSRLFTTEVKGEPIGEPNCRTISHVAKNLYEVKGYDSPTQKAE